MIYFLRAGQSDFVKIGKANDVAARLRELQAGHPETLVILRTLDGGRLHESWFHRRFHASRIRGEWFRFCEEMLTAVPPMEVLSGEPRPSLANEIVQPIRDVIQTFGGGSALSRALGYKHPSTVSNWLRIGIPREVWPDLIDLKGLVGVDSINYYSTLRRINLPFEGAHSPTPAQDAAA